MPTFSAYDGTLLAYHVFGEGAPVICLPGGPMRDSAYLGELGGLSAHRRLIMLDHRGTGRSSVPQDPASYRCDHLVDDVEALRKHAGLDRMDLVAHSAGANVAALYAARHPERVNKLALITPSTKAVGIAVTWDDRREIALLRRSEPWFTAGFAAFEAIVAGADTQDDWQAVAPFFYGRWNATARAHQAAEDDQRNGDAAAAFAAEGAFDPDATRAALATFGAPVLLLSGELDWALNPPLAAEYAELFPNAKLAVQQGGGHFPWLDDADRFATTISAFLG
ncbi:alpha/beta hydrolase [Streptosporangium canum]|uniref:alpha/beta fold hydrolase n=1 Tax=Streptosporangium canum TaxID=324952 RepID=UPI003443B2ED